MKSRRGKSSKRHKRSTTFAHLPKEIRDHIWELAIENKDALPEAHFFTVLKQPVSCYQSREIQPRHNAWAHAHTQLVPVGWNAAERPPKYVPAIPKWSDWMSAENDSAYLLTGHLWNICAESREAVIRHWQKMHPPDSSYQHIDNWIFIRRKFQFYLTMRPQEDLLCTDMENIVYLQINISTRKPKNFGILLDPGWCRRASLINMGFYRTLEFPELEPLQKWCNSGRTEDIFWFIDPELVPTAWRHFLEGVKIYTSKSMVKIYAAAFGE
ncbi:unnamed protein product [Clonostachys rosea]|uniref:Uncharacterized protein n=1 Tax=Bionectria ochroleuca TaxID=29856 RepID=A0ABY6U9B4_BIOOC|nr:unnamed protein product [Clonostachys rosea]